MVLPSARVLEVVVDGGRPVLPGAPVGRDRALDGGRERGDLGEDFGAGTALFRWFLFHAYIIVYAYAKIKREMWGGCINISVHPSWPEDRMKGGQMRWEHSDIKDLSLPYVHKLFIRIVNGE